MPTLMYSIGRQMTWFRPEPVPRLISRMERVFDHIWHKQSYVISFLLVSEFFEQELSNDDENRICSLS